jgi:hypothetical protein
MSYSFSVRADTKAEALEKVSVELDKVVVQQPVHAADRAQAYASAEAFLEVLPSEKAENEDFYVSVSGSVGWRGTQGVDALITSAGASISASVIAKS